MTLMKLNLFNMDLTPEQIQQQEIRATMSTNGWLILMEKFKVTKRDYEAMIDDLEVTDELRYSQRTLIIAMKKMLTAFMEHPETLLKTLDSINQREAK